MALRFSTVAAAVLSALASTSQTVFTSPPIPATDSTQNFAPVGTLDVLSHTAFTTLAHPEFPNYGVRIKKSNFCDEGVGAY
ncbi:hypothetical protein B0H16DRAFT_1579543 [Mycena metata]|uniref:Uncharacterized protein n=1 Tax=Mycena metata TaxID=1033252 RepID=A0AAD7I3T7_9AGAR|nr:hypothetical protein B0H16DRAFT_1579543 [Mycena metata]